MTMNSPELEAERAPTPAHQNRQERCDRPRERLQVQPRSNRAGEINWRHWAIEAFEEAAAEGKLVLLSISAVWCHWCHVMDETTYSDSA